MPHITLVAETGSTNADLIALAGQGWDEGHWLRAERQTAGRGRLGRDWYDGAGNLQASTLIRLGAGDPPVSGLGLLVGVALHEAVSNLVPRADLSLKWPNDLMAGSPGFSAKLAGILLERVGDAVIVGVGVNVANAPRVEGRATVALAELDGGQGVAVDTAMEALAQSLDRWLDRWRHEGFAPIRAAWLAAAHPPGTRLSINSGTDSPIMGRFEGVAEDGALLLGRDDGMQTVVYSGDVGFL